MNLRFWKKPEQRSEETYTPFAEALQFFEIANRQKAMNISAVYRAVEIISDSIAILPVKIKVKDSNSDCKVTAPQHPLNLLFEDNLHNNITKYMLFKLIIQSVLLKGNAFCYIERNKSGQPIKLRYLESTDVTINYNKQRNELYYVSSLVSVRRIETCDMLHFVKNSYDGVNGVSVLSYANRSINIAQSTENAASSFFSNGCNLSGIIKVQGQVTDKQKQDIRASWVNAYKGGGQGLAILPGNMDYQPVQLSASDSQMLESRNYNVQDIARFFGISPVLLGDLSHSSYSTIEATQNQFLLHTLQPYIAMMEAELNRKLVLPSQKWSVSINLDETAIMKTDKSAMASYYSSMLQNSILCVNECRHELGLPPIEGGDKHFVAYTKLEDNIINTDKQDDKGL